MYTLEPITADSNQELDPNTPSSFCWSQIVKCPSDLKSISLMNFSRFNFRDHQKFSSTHFVIIHNHKQESDSKMSDILKAKGNEEFQAKKLWQSCAIVWRRC